MPRNFIVAFLLVAPVLPAQELAERFKALSTELERRAHDTSATGKRKFAESVAGLAHLPFSEDEALRREAETLLRRLLKNPDAGHGVHMAALKSLGEMARSPASVARMLRVAVRQEPTSPLRSAAVRALGALKDPAAIRWLCKEGLGRRRGSTRLVTLEALAHVRHPLVVATAQGFAPVVLRFVEKGKDDLLIAAMGAAANLDLKESLPHLLRYARAKEPALRRAAARALGAFHAAAGVRNALDELLRDPVFWVREAAVHSFARSADVNVCAFLVRRLDEKRARVRAAIFDALRRLTGNTFGDDPTPWKAWWKAQAGSARPAKPDDLAASNRRLRYGPTYHGIPVRSDRVLFIIDVSMSMRFGGGQGEPNRMDVARQEFARVLTELEPETLFNVFVYSTGNGYFRSAGLVRATASTKKKARRWLDSVLPAGGTDSYGALKAGLTRFSNADTIFFLSDGKPSRGMVTDPQEIVTRIAGMNRERRVRINTIALLKTDPMATSLSHEDVTHVAARFMKELAEATGGTFVRRE